MPNETNDLPPPVNHIFVDYENVPTVGRGKLSAGIRRRLAINPVTA